MENLCLACLECNRAKGSDFGSFDPETGAIILLYNPRQQRWSEHFLLEGARIVRLSPEGRVKARQVLLEAGQYPGNSKE